MAGRTNKAVLSYLAVLSLLAFRVDVSHNCIVICKASQSLCSHFRLPSVKMARFAASSRCRLFTRVDICWLGDHLLRGHLETLVVSRAHLYTQTVFDHQQNQQDAGPSKLGFQQISQCSHCHINTIGGTRHQYCNEDALLGA